MSIILTFTRMLKEKKSKSEIYQIGSESGSFFKGQFRMFRTVGSGSTSPGSTTLLTDKSREWGNTFTGCADFLAVHYCMSKKQLPILLTYCIKWVTTALTDSNLNNYAVVVVLQMIMAKTNTSVPKILFLLTTRLFTNCYKNTS